MSAEDPAPRWPDGSGGTVLSFVHKRREAKRSADVEALRRDVCSRSALLQAHQDSMPVSPDPMDPYISKVQWEYEFREWRVALENWERRVRQEARAVAS